MEDAVPLPIARLIHSQHPYFFSTVPTRAEIIDRVIAALECTHSLGGQFEAHFQDETEGVTAWLVWSGTPEAVFIATGKDPAEALFRVVLAMMEHPRFAPCFAEAIRRPASTPGPAPEKKQS